MGAGQAGASPADVLRAKRLLAMDATKPDPSRLHLEILSDDKGMVVADCDTGDQNTQTGITAGTKIVFKACTLTYILY